MKFFYRLELREKVWKKNTKDFSRFVKIWFLIIFNVVKYKQQSIFYIEIMTKK